MKKAEFWLVLHLPVIAHRVRAGLKQKMTVTVKPSGPARRQSKYTRNGTEKQRREE
jgi:hypothetical protein